MQYLTRQKFLQASAWYHRKTEIKQKSVSILSSYTWEKNRNLNDHCNDDCNSSLEFSDLKHERKFVTWMIIVMMIAMRQPGEDVVLFQVSRSQRL